MSYHPPKPRERAAVRRFALVARALDKEGTSLEGEASQFGRDPGSVYEDVNWLIGPRHALEGVRCNGTDDATTLADLKLAIKRTRLSLPRLRRLIERRLKRIEALVKEAESITDHFDLCLACKGKKGAKLGPGDKWWDCGVCNGRGVFHEDQRGSRR